LQFVPYFSEVSGERVFDLFDGAVPLFVLAFDEVADDCAFLVDEAADATVAGLALVDLLADHLQGELVAAFDFSPDGAVVFSVVEGEFLLDFGELARR
jgi:hypothetical protein